MNECGKKFGTYAAKAAEDDVCVTRYGKPSIWMISHAKHARSPNIEKLIPHDHPLYHLRERVDARIAEHEALLQLLLADSPRNPEPEPVVRALLIYTLFSIGPDRALHFEISYNMLYRWFVGFTLFDDIWPQDIMSEATRRLLAHRDVVTLLHELVALAKSVRSFGTDEYEFRINYALLDAWRLAASSQGELA
ncbi:Mobile element protein [plant metagenome]|uniref:Mobile element protein n=1 Tax=plant metagenome TaxID=1297885 RepID=A0A484PQB1_9ZZZZ